MEDSQNDALMKQEFYEFQNLMDDVVYHSNIFNYDKQFLTNLRSQKIKFSFQQFLESDTKRDVTNLKLFLVQFSPEDQLKYLIFSQRKILEEKLLKEEYEGMEESYRMDLKKSKQAVRAIVEYFHLFKYSLDEAEQNTQPGQKIKAGTPHGDNIISCLLYLDGLAMINVDLIKLFSIQSPNCGESLPKLLFRILDNILYDNHIQEIASHILSLSIMGAEGTKNEEADGDIIENFKKLMRWTFENYMRHQREQSDNCLTSNFCLLLTVEDCLDYFVEEYYKIPEQNLIKEMFKLMLATDSPNIIYECLFCMWNISNKKQYLSIFEDKKPNTEYTEKIIQVIRTKKNDKVVRIGLMLIKNLLDSQICCEILFDAKFSKTITILLTNKWNDKAIENLLNFILAFLEKNYKTMNSFEKYCKEIDSGKIKKGSLHTREFWEDNYKSFEFRRFEYIRRLVMVLSDPTATVEQKQVVCFDLGEFARLYPGANGILDFYDAKQSLMKLVEHKDMDLKNRALVCLQKIMMKGFKK